MPAVTTRPTTPDDDPFLFRLYASTRADELAAWGWPVVQQEMFLRLQYTAQRSHYSTAFPESVQHIIERDHAPVGHILVWHGKTEIRLVDIALLPEAQNAGIGTQLIGALVAEGASVGTSVTLHVVKGSPAYRLYHRLGFKPIHDSQTHLFMVHHPVSESRIGPER